jgi:hypothetical protein
MDRGRPWIILHLGILAASCAPRTVVLNDVPDSGAPDAALQQDAPTDSLAQSDAPNGRDAMWPPFPDASCFPRYLHPQPPPEILIELDRSTNMQATFSSYTRMTAVQNALTNEIGVYQNSVKFGYEEFPSAEGGPPSGQCSNCCAGAVTLWPTTGASAWMNNTINCIDGRSNCKGTSTDSPSHYALQVASDFFNMSQMGQSDADQYVMLFTSSEPSCSGQDAATVCQAARNAISGLANNHVQVYVFSVGYPPDKTGCLSDLTKVGSMTTLVTVNDYSDLSGRLDGILHTAAASACTMTLDGPPTNSKLDVYIGPTLVPPDGWTYTPGARNAITLNSTYCSQYVAAVTNDKFGVASYSTCGE